MNFIVADTTEMNAITTMVADDTCFITATSDIYIYQDSSWVIMRSGEPLVFKGITFEQTDYWQNPEMVFRGFSFEQTDYWQNPEMVFRGFSFEHENILRYYGVKIDVNGETERNYIPCIRTSDGIAGLYDTVNGVFYASAGANNFTT